MTVVRSAELVARRIHLQGVVQGVGFRPFVFRLAHAHALRGWVRNGADGLRIHVEGPADALDAFVRELTSHNPPASQIAAIDVAAVAVDAFDRFEILDSDAEQPPTTRIAADLSICEQCLGEMLDPDDRRHQYPYINCTNCGPRFSIVRALPYDRANTTMADWRLCTQCAAEYHDPGNRRFHAQPVACPACGPHYDLAARGTTLIRGNGAIAEAARLLRSGRVVAVKGIGGYHLACDAGNAATVAALRERKYRKEQPFAVMVRDLATAERTVELTHAARALLTSAARPIVLAPSRLPLSGIAPDNYELGVMLPYAPLHHLLFASGAPERLVLTSGNRSSEPIAYEDDDARTRLDGLAEAFLIGERPIARRVDDSVVRAGPIGPMVLRRSRGLAPGVAATVPADRPILALGGDLKNTITLVVGGQAYVSQHIGDLAHHDARRAFDATIRDFVAIYGLCFHDLTVVHDAHPEYRSTAHALTLSAARLVAVQHHRAHIASVLAERGAWNQRVLGIAFDGAGYGDDGTIWGGEMFVGSVRQGFDRVARLHPAALPGGDAAARHPLQAAAGFLTALSGVQDMTAPPFCFPPRYTQACAIIRGGLRTFETTSAGRLFDTVAALLGFTRPTTFEGQAAMWLEHLARKADDSGLALHAPFTGDEIDWRPLLMAIVDARANGAAPPRLARAFHRGLARALSDAIGCLTARAAIDTVVLSGGVFQNTLLIEDLLAATSPLALNIWTNQTVPANDGGLSLGQAALAVAAG